jgi:DNA-binding transcriptional regulator PaaX
MTVQAWGPIEAEGAPGLDITVKLGQAIFRYLAARPIYQADPDTKRAIFRARDTAVRNSEQRLSMKWKTIHVTIRGTQAQSQAEVREVEHAVPGPGSSARSTRRRGGPVPA